MGPRPVVIENIELDAFMNSLLDQHAFPSTLLVYDPRDAFIRGLLQATASRPTMDSPHPLLINTLQLIAQSRTLQVVFCPTLDAVRARLSTYVATNEALSSRLEPPHAKTQPLLAVLGLVEAHRKTASWSAQGLSRTLAIAVEAAHRSGQQLVLTECISAAGSDEETSSDQQQDFGDAEEGHGDSTMEVGEVTVPNSVWEEQVAILNVTTKSFGAGERGWVGRTVKVRKVMERWCEMKTFQNESEPELS